MRRGIDYAWGSPPAPAALRRAGVSFIGRYLSLDAGKNLSATEYRRMRAAGIDCIVVWETSANRARAGTAAGQWDAENAEAQRRRIGMPDVTPIYFAVDFDAAGPEVAAYFTGAGGVLARDRVGAYGGYRVISFLFDARLIAHGWQTYAWSGGRWDPRARVRQYSNGHSFAGVDCDLDVWLPEARSSSPASSYWPADERRWEQEYDRLLRARGPWPAMRRRVLRRVMTARRKRIWRLAEPAGEAGWHIRNRRARYRALRARTEA